MSFGWAGTLFKLQFSISRNEQFRRFQQRRHDLLKQWKLSQITERFRELVETAGDSLPANHYDELSLLIEAGIDSALVEYMEKMADKLESMAHDLRISAEFFD